ncbi:MAG: beta-ketoacyl synthase N-terminal-like domain-containing protein [Myxococcota bacterium]|nr:beta-ketoacyl synthase N-terminal-like domain-containing protein [Myxococcota bacterium]
MGVVLRSIGLATPIGDTTADFVQSVLDRKTGITEIEHFHALPSSRGARVQDQSLRGVLKKRKDAKLYTPAARIGLLAARRCLQSIEPKEDLGLFVAVGREPPDDGEAEACLLASQHEAQFCESKMTTEGRALYPPLLPLKTLPNMVLAHIAIQLQITGENAVWAGGRGAAGQAVHSAYWSILEGRCSQVLVGASDSFLSLGAARDLYRQGIDIPGEAAVFLLLESSEAVENPIAVMSPTSDTEQKIELKPLLGHCGSAQGLLELVYLIFQHQIISWGGFSFRK